MTRTLFIECVAGIAGDMFAASFVDAGLVSNAQLEAVPKALGLDAMVLIEPRQTAGTAATGLEVRSSEGGSLSEHGHFQASQTHGATYVSMDAQLRGATLRSEAIAFARSGLRAVAAAEAEAHGVEIEEVHFHELGLVDTLIDFAMAGVCVAESKADAVMASPVKLGHGLVTIAHGTYPVPPPATARLVIGFETDRVPDEIGAENVELSTPTGLAILRALEPDFTRRWPAGRVVAQGSGCGSMDLGSYPNILRTVMFETDAPRVTSFEHDEVFEVIATIDDDSPEHTAWVADQVRAAGALDVWLTPIFCKKGRPGFLFSVLTPVAELDRFIDLVLRLTTTFGVRYQKFDRAKLSVRWDSRTVDGKPVRYRIGETRTGEVVREKPEFEDVRHVWERATHQDTRRSESSS